MGRRQALRFRPGLDSLETRSVMSASGSGSMVHAAVAPVSVPIATYNQTFSQINNAFYAYEGPLDDTINAISSFASSVASNILSPNSPDPTDNSGSSDVVPGGKGDAGALESRLQGAISKLPGGQAEADLLINRTFAYGGLTTSDAGYFKGKITALVKQSVTQEIRRGELVLVWPGQHPSSHRS